MLRRSWRTRGPAPWFRSLLWFLGPLVWAAPAPAELSGVVSDAATSAPLEGVIVSIQATGISTLSDSQGHFLLPDHPGSDLVLVGAFPGYFSASTKATAPETGLSLELEAVPVVHNDAYEFKEPIACRTCHPNQVEEWTDSPMANAGLNTWVHDIYSGDGTPTGEGGFVYIRDSVHAESNPSSECSACHQPERWIHMPFSPMGKRDSFEPEVLHGVSCEVCHKIARVDEEKPNFPGVHADAVTMTLPEGIGFAIQYGALPDAEFAEAGSMRPSYQPQLRAVVCGTCHQDKNDHDLDGDFEDEGGVISEPTFLEWLDSPYSNLDSPDYRDCVDCHMPATGAPAACDDLMETLGRPSGDVRNHRIVGTTAEFLENSVTLRMDAQVDEDGLVVVTVAIKNDQVGHHVPTGVTIRNMILLVEAEHEDGTPLEFVGDQTIHELGGVGPKEEGYFAGLAGKLYAKLNVDAAGSSPTFFTDAVGLKFDSRIPAGETDETSYVFSSEVGGAATVRARLVYRRAWRALVDAKQWSQDGHGLPLEDLQAPHFGHLMEESTASVQIPVPPAFPPGEGGLGGDDNSASAGASDQESVQGSGSTGSGGCGCSLTPRRKVPYEILVLLSVLLGVRRKRSRA